ncbi:MAG: divalent-cation tolerance protein CutA [Pelagibacterales bacterium]|nr:divalent-cation tolerance protein CutA [Pelagibacterales bacterium]OUU62879.1 MAG: hypothetical protein CBC22_03020 [Alphaproteobacteria bacterium TMED62]|tara:strand:+ start:1003 stop:1332 length:330 start_codon:yes stop_codon:yes gene_type:complete
MEKLIIIKTTISNKNTKNKLINELLKNNYVACINIIENITSYYEWEGKLQRQKEEILFIKTILKNEKLVYKIIKKYHDYEIPEITTISVKNIDKNYLGWIKESILGKKL